jgi:predicted metal-dependent hydrolase
VSAQACALQLKEGRFCLSLVVIEQDRWASCGSIGVLNFHWKCMMAPPRIIDYIVVHELCHFHHRNHTDAFWNEVDKVMPDYRERKEWLRKHGASLAL